MQYTSNYHLSKPENDDIINPNSRTGYNGNFDTIDTNLKSVSNKANTNENNIATLQSDVIDLNAKTGDDIPFESGSANSISDKITNLDNSVGSKPSGETDTLWDKVDTLENRDTYSTTEQVIGTWTDGKPIYRKVFTFTPDSKNYTHTHNIPIDSVVSFRATKSGVSLPILFTSSTDALLQNSIGCWITQAVVRLLIGSAQTIGDVTCIVEYTKTTD